MARAALGALLIGAALSGYAAAAELQCGEPAAHPDLAIEACTRVIQSGRYAGPDLAKAYYSRGTEHANAGDHEHAISDFNVALELEPRHAGALLNRALSLSARGESDRAIADYEAALKLNPRDSNALLGRAAEWIAKGEYARAIADFDEIVRLGQAMAGYFGRARARFYAGDFMGAASDFYRVHQLEGSVYSAVWMYLARKHADIPGEQTLAQDAGTNGGGEWPAPLVSLFLGTATPEAVLKAAAHPEPARSRSQQCEANYYVAQWHVLRDAREAAIALLRDAAAACPRAYVEHEAARVELRRLGAPAAAGG